MRRLTRYCIRSLLVLVTLSCVVLGWYATNVRAYRAERGALVRLEEMHGKLHIEIRSVDPRCYPFPDDDAVGSAVMEPISPFGVHRLFGNGENAFSRVTQLSLSTRTLDFRVFEMLSQFPHLALVYVDGDHITQADRKRIADSLPSVTFDFYLMEIADENSEPVSEEQVRGDGKRVTRKETPFILDAPSSDDNPFDFD